MTQPIQRAGQWWWQNDDGNWLRWNAKSEAWEPHAGSPPSPPLPEPTSPAPRPQGVTPSPSGLAANRDLVSAADERPPATEWIRDKRVVAGGLACVVVAAVATTLAILSNDEDPSSTISSPPPAAEVVLQARKAAFIKKVDGICSRAQRKADRAPLPENLAELVAVTNWYASVNQGLTSQLKKMGWPRKDRRVLRRMVAVSERGTAVFRDIARTAYDPVAFRSGLERWEKIRHQYAALALKYGFEKCRIFAPR